MAKPSWIYISQLPKESKAVEFIEEKSPYNPKFVKMVLDASKEKGGIEINPDNVWESIN